MVDKQTYEVGQKLASLAMGYSKRLLKNAKLYTMYIVK
jgi:hypothetical protein